MSYVDYTYENQMLIEENKRLREQVAHLSPYKPGYRIEREQEPVKAIGPTNWSFYGMADATELVAD